VCLCVCVRARFIPGFNVVCALAFDREGEGEIVSKETYFSVKRNLLQCQKRPTSVSREGEIEE